MNDRIALAARSPLAAARMCEESPGDLIHALDGYTGLSAANRSRVDALVAGAAGDPDFGCRLAGLVRHEGFRACDAAHQALVLEGIAGEPDARILGRLEVLADDPEFRRMMPREAARQADEVLSGTAFPDVEQMVRASGARGHHGSFSLPGAIDLGAHTAEVVVDVALEHLVAVGLSPAVAGIGAGVGGGVLCTVAMVAGLAEIAEEHRAGRALGERVAAGGGFVAQMAHHLRGDEAVDERGARGRGAAAADRFWNALTPSQRVELRTVDGQDEVLRALAASVEGITMGTHGQAE